MLKKIFKKPNEKFILIKNKTQRKENKFQFTSGDNDDCEHTIK